MNSETPVHPQTIQDELDRRALATMPWVLSGIAVLFVVFFVYNAVDFPAGIREPALVYDAAMVVLALVTLRLLRTGRVPHAVAHALGAAFAIATAGNVLMVMGLLGDVTYTVYIDIIVVAAGATLLDFRWTAATVGALWGMWLPLAVGLTTEPQDTVRFGFTLLAATVIGLAMQGARLRDERTVARLAALDRHHRAALQAALEQAEHAQRELDGKVAERTAALSETNAALRFEIRERQRAQQTVETLAEQLVHSQRLEAMGRLAGGVAHDFNNLLTAIRGNLNEALEDAALPEAQRPALSDALGAASRAASLTKQLLAFGRRQVLERRAFDLVAAFEGMHRMLERTLGDRIQLEAHGPDEPVWVQADQAQIEGVILNLALNARDAMPDGGVVEVSLSAVDDDGTRWALLQVRDAGMGMDERTASRVFEPFFTTKELGQGTGLGLSTAYGVIQQHGGRITVQSAVGAGSTFEVWLPVRDQPRVQPSPPETPSTSPGGSETVLFVEDDEAVRRLGKRVLLALGYHVLVAANAQEAEEIAAQADHIDVLFTDIQMPGRTGMELAESLRRERPHLPVLLCSGFVGDAGVEALIRPGTALLHKPYTRPDLAEALREAIDGATASAPRSG